MVRNLEQTIRFEIVHIFVSRVLQEDGYFRDQG